MKYLLTNYDKTTKRNFDRHTVAFNIYKTLSDDNTSNNWFISVEHLREDNRWEDTGLQCVRNESNLFTTEEQALAFIPKYIELLNQQNILEIINDVSV